MKKIIFDLGNVLVRFEPEQFLKDLFKDKIIIQRCKEVYFHGLWNEYDRGFLSKEDMIEKGSHLYPENRKDFSLMMEKWTSYVTAIEGNIKYIETLMKKGYDLYILSNIPQDCYEYLLNNEAWFQNMTGVYSFQEKTIKPEEKIYQILLDRFHLKSDECIFVDDKLENIQAAEKLGFIGLHCTDASQLPSWLERKL